MHEVALVLATAGASLDLDASNQHLGMLMLMCSMVVKWWEGRKNNQKPMGSEKEPMGHKRKDEHPETRINKNPMRALRKGEQDPIWTSKGKENGTKCRKYPEGTPGFSAAPFVGKGGGRSPGLRTFRMSSKRNDEEEKRGAHGKAMAAGSEASAGSMSASSAAAASAAGHEEVVAANVTRFAEDLQVQLQSTRDRQKGGRAESSKKLSE